MATNKIKYVITYKPENDLEEKHMGFNGISIEFFGNKATTPVALISIFL